MELILWGSVVTLFMLNACIFFYKGKQRETFNEKVILYGAACIMFCPGFSIIFFILAVMRYQGMAEIYLWLALTIVIIGNTLFILSFDIIVKRSKYFLSITNIVLIILINIFYIIEYNLSELFYNYIFYPFSVISPLIIILIFTKLSRRESRAVASFLSLGFILIHVGGTFAFEISLRELNIIPLILPPILYIIGILLILTPTLIDPKYLSRAFIYWRVIGAILIILLCFLEFYFILTEVPVYLVFRGLVWITAFSYVFYRIFKITKSETFMESKKEFKDLLGVFTKPEKITEEEVSISKEKKICLVCKGKVSRYQVYLCPECEAIYCHNCAHALENLENACWVCNAPVDESKPIKLFKIEEEKIEVEKEMHEKENSNK